MQGFTAPRGSSSLHSFQSGQCLRVAHARSTTRNYSSRGALLIECKESRIGKQPVVVPQAITVDIKSDSITCKAGQNELTRNYDPTLVKIAETEEKGTYAVSRVIENRHARMAHGLTRSLFDGMVVGLSEGFTKTLTLIGVGYRAISQGPQITLNLGYSNPVVMQVPEGITVEVVKNTTVHIRGYDKVAVGQFAADIRFKRPPEPYKGKGVRYQDEFVPKKEGKGGKK